MALVARKDLILSEPRYPLPQPKAVPTNFLASLTYHRLSSADGAYFLGMSDDSKPKSQTLPSWQQTGQDEKDEPREQSSTGSDVGDTRSDLKARAAKFLDEEQIRNASTERKIEFLERKGLDHDEIQELLGAAGSTDEKQLAPPVASKGEVLVGILSNITAASLLT